MATIPEIVKRMEADSEVEVAVNYKVVYRVVTQDWDGEPKERIGNTMLLPEGAYPEIVELVQARRKRAKGGRR